MEKLDTLETAPKETTQEDETSETDTEKNNNDESNEKRFSQNEVDEIIKKRLTREREKHNQKLAEKDKEIQSLKLESKAKELIKKKGYKDNVLKFIDLTSEETLEESFKRIKEINNSLARNAPLATTESADANGGLSSEFQKIKHKPRYKFENRFR